MNATPNYKRKIDQSPAADAESKRMDMKITPTKEGLNNTNQTQSEREQSELDEIKAKGAPEWYIASLQRITRQFDEVNNRLSGFEITTNNEIADLKKTVEEQNKKILEQEAKLAEALDRLDKCEDYSRNSNLIFENVEERYQENTEKILLDIFKTNLKIDSEIQISDSHRLGKKVNAKPRPLIVRFVKVKDRKQVWAARRNLAGTKLIMKEHYSKGTDDARKTLYPYYRKAQKAPEVKKCRLFRDQLQIDGKSYGTADIVKLPHGLDQQRIHTVNKNGCTFFFSRDAPLSNFHRATFKVDD